MKHPAQISESPWPHRLAVVLVCATFPLIWVGGLVTTYQAGMAVDDWPTTFGYNPLLYPWQSWLAAPWNFFIEHGHRLFAIPVGLITIVLVVVAFCFDSRTWLRAAAFAALALVIFQGVLGGARVLLDQRQLALVHGIVGPTFFSFAVALAVFTSKLWKTAPAAQFHASAARLHTLSIFTAALAFAQLVVGAHLRHLPITADPNFFRGAVLFHLLLAGLLALHAVAVGVVVWRQFRSQTALCRPALGLCALLCLQLALGSATWVAKYAWPDWFAGWLFAESYTIEARSLWQSLTVTAHVATGSLILGSSVLLALRSFRLVSKCGKHTACAVSTGTRSLPATSADGARNVPATLEAAA